MASSHLIHRDSELDFLSFSPFQLFPILNTLLLMKSCHHNFTSQRQCLVHNEPKHTSERLKRVARTTIHSLNLTEHI